MILKNFNCLLCKQPTSEPNTSFVPYGSSASAEEDCRWSPFPLETVITRMRKWRQFESQLSQILYLFLCIQDSAWILDPYFKRCIEKHLTWSSFVFIDAKSLKLETFLQKGLAWVAHNYQGDKKQTVLKNLTELENWARIEEVGE